MELFFFKVVGYIVTKKGRPQGFSMWNVLNFSKQFFLEQLFGKSSVSFMQLWHFTSVFNTVGVFLQFHLDSCPGAATIIWLTKQIKIPETVELFLETLSYWSLVLINPQVSITQAGLRHFSRKILFFFRKSNLQSTRNCLLLILRHFS